MGTAYNESAWSTTAASNDGIDSSLGTIANTSSPTSVDDWVRGLMASRAKARLDLGGGLVAGGSATALTVTTNQSLSSSHIANGLRLAVRTASASTGAATIAIDGLTAVDIKKNDGSAIVAGDWASGSLLDLVYSSTATAFIAANIAPKSGIVLLTSGTASSVATLGIALTSYTGYRGIKIVLSGWRPATDGANLWVRFSSDGGSNYDTSGYNYALILQGSDGGTPTASQSGSAGQIIIAVDVGSAATEGYNGEVTLLNQTSSAFWSRITHSGYWMDSVATPGGAFGSGGGARETNQDTDAIRFLFSTGNITAGNYAVYGLA